MCRYCCKKILGTCASNIDSRSGANAKCRFNNTFARSRLLRVFALGLLCIDFCNNICHIQTSRDLILGLRDGGPGQEAGLPRSVAPHHPPLPPPSVEWTLDGTAMAAPGQQGRNCQPESVVEL